MYNEYWGHGGIFWRRLVSARNQNPCVHFDLDIETTRMQFFQLFLFRYFILGVLLNNIDERVEGEKFPYAGFLVFIGL